MEIFLISAYHVARSTGVSHPSTPGSYKGFFNRFKLKKKY
jgi:hypothetical protein